MLEKLVNYGYLNCDCIILEGIFYSDIYDSLFKQIKYIFAEKMFVYYFDLSFEETLRRHQQRPKKSAFGESEMRKWWRSNNYLTYFAEKRINSELNLNEIVDLIYRDITRK